MKDLLLLIKGTMSDRCEAMKKFNRIRGEFRKDCLNDIGIDRIFGCWHCGKNKYTRDN